MKNNMFIVAGSYSIAIAAVTGLIRLPKLYRAYQPFILITIISFLNEVVSHMLILHQRSNAIAINIFGLFDAFLWLWQFSVWNSHYKRRKLYCITSVALGVLWFVENIVLQQLFVFGAAYPITFSTLMVLFSADELTRQLAHNSSNVLTSPKFMICCGAILFYTYRILVECFYAPHISASETFLSNVFTILSFVNFIVNLLFAFVVLWIPQKQKFSLPYY